MRESVLGYKLKEYRDEKGLTQKELAELLDVSGKSISKWELGEGYPSKKNLMKLSEILEISIETLLIEQNQEENNELKRSIKYGVVSYILIFISSMIINSFQIDFTSLFQQNNRVSEVLKVLVTQFINNNLLSLPPAIIIGCIFYFFVLPKKVKSN